MRAAFIAIVLVVFALKPVVAIAQQGMPSSEEIQKRLNALPPEKRAKMLEDFRRAIEGLDILSDLQSGKCTRGAEVQIKAGEGDAESVYTLSDMYRHGWCVAKNVMLFHENLEKAAKLGKASAAFDIGYYYENGTEGYPKAIDAATQWYQTAIAAGDVRAMVQLGQLLLEGKQVPKNTQSGLQLLSRAADMDEENIDASNKALGLLAIYYMDGENTPPNLAVSRTYALRGAAQCDGASMTLVAITFENQNPPDLNRAYAWANVATQHNNNGPRLEFANRVKGQLAQRIGTDALSAAQTLSQKLPICLPPEARKRAHQ